MSSRLVLKSALAVLAAYSISQTTTRRKITSPVCMSVKNNDAEENEETEEQEEDRSEGSDILPDGRNSVLCSPNTPKLTLQRIKALQPLVMVSTLSNPTFRPT